MFEVCIKESFSFSDKSCIDLSCLQNLERVSYSPGVYILHKGKISDIWTEEGNIFYIGASFKEGLRTRATKHRSVLLRELCTDSKNSCLPIKYQFF
jgi:hypothetical protein